CTAGEVDTEYQSGVPCGNCGTKTQYRQRTCNSGCSWGSWGGWSDTTGPTDGCTGEGVCGPGESQYCSPSGWYDPECWTYEQECDGSCSWDSCVCTEYCWEIDPWLCEFF
ncbi:MAG: hypothetical protein QF464_17615, partial [Myxococcota bacterium]|nr:hypothetical protein [Myxococcota bacterium]